MGKINVLFDGKRIKLEGSNLLKNKLCGLCGDSNNKMVGDVPSPRQCLLSSPKLEPFNHDTTGRYSSSSIGSSISGSEVSDLPQWPPGMNNCSHPMWGYNCPGVSYDPVCGVDSVSYTNECYARNMCHVAVACRGKCPCENTFSAMTGSEDCMRHRHMEQEDIRHGREVLCFSKRPVPECAPKCHGENNRVKVVEFTCMPKADRKTQHIAEKVRRGDVVPELENLPTSYTFSHYLPGTCKRNTAYGGDYGSSII